MSDDARKKAGRIAFRIENDWWVAYYAQADTMRAAIELGRVQMAIVVQNETRKKAFMEIMRSYVEETIPMFASTESKPASDNERT